jgi:hypothetical protein
LINVTRLRCLTALAALCAAAVVAAPASGASSSTATSLKFCGTVQREVAGGGTLKVAAGAPRYASRVIVITSGTKPYPARLVLRRGNPLKVWKTVNGSDSVTWDNGSANVKLAITAVNVSKVKIPLVIDYWANANGTKPCGS